MRSSLRLALNTILIHDIIVGHSSADPLASFISICRHRCTGKNKCLKCMHKFIHSFTCIYYVFMCTYTQNRCRQTANVTFYICRMMILNIIFVCIYTWKYMWCGIYRSISQFESLSLSVFHLVFYTCTQAHATVQ